MSDKGKKQNGQADGANSQKPEKKMTKYDLKMQRRKEEELRQQRKARYSAIIGVVVVLLIVGVLGWKFYEGYQDKHGTYVTVGDMTFSGRNMNITIIAASIICTPTMAII